MESPGALNAFALAVLIAQPVVADGGVDNCPPEATGCNCIVDSENPEFVPDGCYEDPGLGELRCEDGRECGES